MVRVALNRVTSLSFMSAICYKVTRGLLYGSTICCIPCATIVPKALVTPVGVGSTAELNSQKKRTTMASFSFIYCHLQVQYRKIQFPAGFELQSKRQGC